MQPFEIIAAGFQVYAAAVGTAFPDVDEDPGVGWSLVGTNGNKNISEDGVSVKQSEDIEEFRMVGANGPIKAARTSEGLEVSFTLNDLSLEQYAAALGFNAVTTTAPGAGTIGTKSIGLAKGLDLVERALLIRGPSPYGEWNMQWQIPRVYPKSESEIVGQKGEPAGLDLTFTALVDLDAASDAEQFGIVIAQHAVATG